MALNKIINTSYTLKTINASDTVTMDTSLVTITGNLVVLGNQASLSTTNTAIFDNVITLNAGLSPSIPPTLNAGIEVDRGTLANVQLRWNESVKNWQVTTNGSTYANIATTAGAGSALTAVSQDTAPILGGNLDVQSYQIYSTLITSTVPGVRAIFRQIIHPITVHPKAIFNAVIKTLLGCSNLGTLYSFSYIPIISKEIIAGIAVWKKS